MHKGGGEAPHVFPQKTLKNAIKHENRRPHLDFLTTPGTPLKIIRKWLCIYELKFTCFGNLIDIFMLII